MYFDQNLCLFHLDVENQKELFEKMYQTLYTNQCVKESYLDAIIKREEEYPTGILFADTGFAIPHTDSKHVMKSQICFASLNKPIEFKDMTNINHSISVELVFMLAMSQPHEQIQTLQNLMALFQDEESVKKLKECSSQEEFKTILSQSNIE